MEENMTSARMANAIMQDNGFKGCNILVEGKTDFKLYRKLVSKDVSKIKVTFGKEKMRDVYRILDKRDFSKVLGIRDADFIRIRNNEKFDPNYSHSIFLIDNHDSEGMIINSPAFDDFLFEVSKDAKEIEKFKKKYGCIRVYLYKLSRPLAYLRFSNRKYDLGLAFTPIKPEGNTLRFKKYQSKSKKRIKC